MLTRLAELGIRAPRRVLAVAALLLVCGAAFGASVADHLLSGGFNDPSSPSSRADREVQQTFHAGAPNLVLEVSSPDGVNSPAARAEGKRLVAAVKRSPYTEQVSSYWTSPAGAGLRSTDGRSALVVAAVAGDDTTSPGRAATIAAPLTGTHDGVSVRAGGIAPAYAQANDQIRKDLDVAEMIAIPITVLALIWVFGSVVASLLPLAVGLGSIVGTMAILRALTFVTDVSIYALNMTTALGFALAIDYSLFIVSRYREQLRAGDVPDDAVRHAMQTAGRGVLFAALTVALSLAAMLIFPVYFLRSFAYAGIGVVVFATLAALLVLPALLTLIGRRVDALDVRRAVRRLLRRPEPAPRPVEAGSWYRFATAVMRRAVPVTIVVTAVLVGLGLPFLHAHFGYPDDRVLPRSIPARQVGDSLRTRYASNATSTIDVVIPDISAHPGAIAGYGLRLSRIPEVSSVASAAGTFATGHRAGPATGPPRTVGSASYLTLAFASDPFSATARNVLAAVKHTPAPWPVLLGGATADNADSIAVLARALPWAVAWIAAAIFVVLFLFTGSLVLPLKTLVLNTLSLSATFGAMVWVFQYGHFGSLYTGLTTTGYLVPTMPLLMFCVAFGLSMDYEVMVVSRIREEWLAGGRTSADNARAIALGLARSGRIVTAAALLMAIVFAAIASSRVSLMMLFGTGLALAVVMDATVVRATLVPAVMRLAGRWNWWAPRPLARLHERIGLTEAPAVPPEREAVTL